LNDHLWAVGQWCESPLAAGYIDLMASSRTVLCFAFIAALFQSAPNLSAQARQAFPVAYISVQRILAESEDAKAATKELEALRLAKAQDVNAKKQALDKTKLEIANAGGLFSGSRRAELTEQAKRQEAELQKATQQAQVDLNDLQKKIQQRLQTEIGSIVSELAVARGVQYVLNQDTAIVVAPTGANWTAEVLERLNRAAAQKKASDKPDAGGTPKK
jgi:Skp family chaperone for outer membrane proteins